jgi:diaminopimelate decarboxylase
MSRSAHPAGPRHADVLPEGHYSAPPADLNALDPKVWAQTVERGEDGVVTVGGISVTQLAEEYGTPAYVLDEADFRARARAWRTAFGADADVFYAGKAFLSRAVVRWLHEEGLNLDVCSGGELATALSAGMPADRIAFHGNNKSPQEIERAVRADVGRIVLDSFQEIARVAHIAQSLGKRQRVQIRITVGVEAHTHEFIATAHEDQKFGIPLAGGQAAEAVRRALQLDGLELIGIHSHIGSQIFDMSGFEVAAHRVVGLLKDIRDEHGVELPEIDLGGGLGIAYTSDDDPREPHEIAKSLTEIVTRECERRGSPSSRGAPSSDPPPSRSTRSAPSSPSRGCVPTSPSTAACRTTSAPRCTTPSTPSPWSPAPPTPSPCSPGSWASTARAATSW